MFMVVSGSKGPVIGVVAEWDDARILQQQDPEARIIALNTVLSWGDVQVVSDFGCKIRDLCKSSIDVHMELMANRKQDLNG